MSFPQALALFWATEVTLAILCFFAPGDMRNYWKDFAKGNLLACIFGGGAFMWWLLITNWDSL